MKDTLRLNTKLTVCADGLELKEHCSFLIFTKHKGPVKKTILRVFLGDFQGDYYDYYLETLLNIGITESNPISNELVLNFGINLMVTGMLEVYREIINNLILK